MGHPNFGARALPAEASVVTEAAVVAEADAVGEGISVEAGIVSVRIAIEAGVVGVWSVGRVVSGVAGVVGFAVVVGGQEVGGEFVGVSFDGLELGDAGRCDERDLVVFLDLDGFGVRAGGRRAVFFADVGGFAVEDADVASAKAAELGATVPAGVFDVGPDGRMSVIIDPTGAAFCIWRTFSSSVRRETRSAARSSGDTSSSRYMAGGSCEKLAAGE